MSRKKSQKNTVCATTDFTINDFANASKIGNKIKKSLTNGAVPPDVLAWDEIDEDEFDIVEEIQEDGTKSFVYKKKKRKLKPEEISIEDRPGLVYPEIVWYLISKYIKPEDVGNFAGINKAAYSATKRESFWRRLYHKYCVPEVLPEELKIEKNDKLYGLRQRVIRALYYTHRVFILKLVQKVYQDSKPHQLVKRRCVNLWYTKGTEFWYIYFKFKKPSPFQVVKTDFIEELGRIDANPEEDCQVLQVICQNFYDLPPLMGLTLTSVNLYLSQGFREHRLHLGFNTSTYTSKDILPEHLIVLDSIVSYHVLEWWHPHYPFTGNSLPSNIGDEEALPVLKKDFFSIRDGEL